MSVLSHDEDERLGPLGYAFAELWREGMSAKALALAALGSHVHTRDGECFPERLDGPEYRAVGIDLESLVAILADFQAQGLVRVGPGRRFFLRSDLAADIVQGRRKELREQLRVFEGGRA